MQKKMGKTTGEWVVSESLLEGVDTGQVGLGGGFQFQRTDLGFIWKGPGSFEYKSVQDKENSKRYLKVYNLSLI